MTPKLSNIDDLRKALSESCGEPVEVEDDKTRKVYVMVTREEFEKKYRPMYDDSDPDPRDFYPAFAEAVGDDLDAPGMEAYDDDTPDTDA